LTLIKYQIEKLLWTPFISFLNWFKEVKLLWGMLVLLELSWLY